MKAKVSSKAKNFFVTNHRGWFRLTIWKNLKVTQIARTVTFQRCIASPEFRRCRNQPIPTRQFRLSRWPRHERQLPIALVSFQLSLLLQNWFVTFKELVVKLTFKWAIHDLYFFPFDTSTVNDVLRKNCWWLDSNPGSLALEATTLPTATTASLVKLSFDN